MKEKHTIKINVVFNRQSIHNQSFSNIVQAC